MTAMGRAALVLRLVLLAVAWTALWVYVGALTRCAVDGCAAAGLLTVWPARRRVLSGWSCSCGTYNHEHAGVCAGCGKGRS